MVLDGTNFLKLFICETWMRTPLRGLFVCVLFLWLCGFEAEKSSAFEFVQDAQKSDQETQKSDQKTKQKSRRRAPSGKTLLLDDLIKNGGYSNRTITALHEMKLHRTTIRESSLNILLDQYDTNSAVANRMRNRWPPIASESPPQPEAVYATTPLTMEQMLDGWMKFKQIGLEHFASREIEGVDKAARENAIKVYKEALSSPFVTKGKTHWTEIDRQLMEISRTVPALKNKDPMLHYCLGLVRRKQKQTRLANGCFRIASSQLTRTKYPSRFLVESNRQIVDCQRELALAIAPARRMADYFVSLRYWLKHDFRATPGEHRYAFRMVKEFFDQCELANEWGLVSTLSDEVWANEQLPVWFRAIVKGQANSELAWKWRGSGMPGDIDADHWKKFEEYQSQAAADLKRAHELNPHAPEAASLLIGVSMTGHEDESEQYWFEKAIDAQPDYLPAYDQFIFSLLPQWGGSTEKMYRFAESHAAKEAYETSVPYIMVTCYYRVEQWVGTHAVAEPKRRKEFAKNMVKAIDGLLESDRRLYLNDSVRDKDYLLTLKGIIGSNEHLYTAAKDSFDQLGNRFDQDAIDKLREPHYFLLRGRANAFSSKLAKECRELLAIYKTPGSDKVNENRSRFITKCSKLIDEVDDEHARTWLKTLRDKSAFEYEFSLGMNASLPFDPNLCMWTCGQREQFKYESEDSVLIDSNDAEGRMVIRSLIGVPGPKIIEFDVELLDTEEKRNLSFFTPSVTAMEYRNSLLVIGLSRVFNYKKKLPPNVYAMGQVAFGYRDGPNPLYYYTVPILKGPNRFRIKVAKSFYEVYLNDRFVFRSTAESVAPHNFLDVCQPQCRRGRGKARVSGLRLESWNSPPPPIRDSPEKLVEYYANEVEASPDDYWAAFWFAQATHANDDIKDAIDLYQEAIEKGMRKSSVAFFLGDCHDREGDHMEAIKWYKVAAAIADEDPTAVFPRHYSAGYSNSCHWAAFRLAWWKYNSPDESLRNSIVPEDYCRFDARLKHGWAVELFPAMEQARTGEFESAERLGNACLAKCADDEKHIVTTLLEAWRAGKEYREEKGVKPLYLKMKKPIPFFRCFEDYVEPEWKGTY